MMRAFITILCAGIVALIALKLYAREPVDANTFQLPTVKMPIEEWQGQAFTAREVDDIKALIDRESRELPQMKSACAPAVVLWLGNSQLHTINYAKPGDHLAPYWVRKWTRCPDSTIPLGVSLPNANLQEHYILAKYAFEKVPVKLLLLELCFDDLREDGLRDEFGALLQDGERGSLSDEPVARGIIDLAEAEWKHVDPNEENPGLDGFVQKGLEDQLDSGLGTVWPLWAKRQHLRVKLLTDIYFLRNDVLGIKPTTVRKLIAPRYDRNMAALEALLGEARDKHIPVVAYIAPIRNDVPLPYDSVEYARWKSVVEPLARKYGATFANLENLVPGSLWGSYHGDDIDFMHFQGPGHQLLAKAVLLYVEAATQAAN